MNITKAIEISDAKIQFVSLVDKAANKREFLITKAENGNAQFSTYGRILKVDDSTHYITGIVYEPLIEDAHGNFMTEEEIIKAAYWFAKNGDKVDIQHSFDAADGVCVVENYIAPCDMTMDDTPIVKGTWLITVEVTNADIWESVQKGDITGFSMGGLGKYSEEDIDLNNVQKKDGTDESPEKKSLFKKLAEAFGLAVVEKGDMNDGYAQRAKSNNFWAAIDTLTNLLCQGHWDYIKDMYVYDFEENEAKITEALTEFHAIMSDILLQDSITKAIYASPPAKPMLQAGVEKNIKEEPELKKEEIQSMIDEAVRKAMTPPGETPPATDTQEPVTSELIRKMIDEAVEKALGDPESPAEPEPLTADSVRQMIDSSVAKAIEPILKARGLATNLNDEHDPVEKSEETHYLNGIL